MNQAIAKKYVVEGMSCGHCRAAVDTELRGLDGVDEVAVDLITGAVEIRGRDVLDEEVEAAVERAGYRLAGQA